MLRSTILLAMLLGLSAAATLTKKDGYGGSAATYSAPSSYGTSGSSYDAGSQPASYSSGSEASYGSSGAASYSSGSPSYGSGSPASYGSSSYNSGSEGYQSSANSGGDSGNLYYYYYPVTNHTSSGNSYGGAQGGNSYSSGGQGPNYGGGNNYYPPAPVQHPYSDPLGGLLSLVGAIDVNSLILPALLIGGVALLLPAILNCDLELGTCVIPLPFTGNGNLRGQRALDEWGLQQATIPQMIDSAYRIYDAVYESDQCMQRVVCELGGMMRNVRGKETFFNILEQFATPTVKKQLYVLKQGALATPSLNPACSKFICDKLDNKVE